MLAEEPAGSHDYMLRMVSYGLLAGQCVIAVDALRVCFIIFVVPQFFLTIEHITVGKVKHGNIKLIAGLSQHSRQQ